MRKVKLRYVVELLDWSVMHYGATGAFVARFTYYSRERAQQEVDTINKSPVRMATITEEEYEA